jgi:hypothetical protein
LLATTFLASVFIDDKSIFAVHAAVKSLTHRLDVCKRRVIALTDLTPIAILDKAMLAVHQTSDRITLVALANLAAIVIAFKSVLTVHVTHDCIAHGWCFSAFANITSISVNFETMLAIAETCNIVAASWLTTSSTPAEFTSLLISLEAKFTAHEASFRRTPGFFLQTLANWTAGRITFETKFAIHSTSRLRTVTWSWSRWNHGGFMTFTNGASTLVSLEAMLTVHETHEWVTFIALTKGTAI